MQKELSREQAISLLRYSGMTNIKYEHTEKDNVLGCCPVHGESNPSMGYSFSKNTAHCFSCHWSGNIQWLLFKTCPDEFKNIYEVEEWIKDRYNVDLGAEARDLKRQLRRYEDMEDLEESNTESKHEIPMFNLAPYKSGKETYKYFFNRGFNKQDMIYFKIGRDIVNETVTIPLFNLDGTLFGIIGRFIDNNRPKNSRYRVYECPKAKITYPVDKLEIIDDTLILVEGTFDAMWLHKLGFVNSQALQTNKMTYDQAELLRDNFTFSKVILAMDNDKGGERAIDIIKQRLGDDYTYHLVKYPDGVKDVQEMTYEQIKDMFDNCIKRKFRRINN